MTSGAIRGAATAVLGAIVAGGAALGFSLAATPSYTATATLMVSTPIPDATTAAGRAVAVLNPRRQVETNERLLSLPVIAQRTARLIEGQTASAVSRHVSVSVEGTSYLYAISAKAERPVPAARLANVYASQFVAFRSSLDAARLDTAVARIRSQLHGRDVPAEVSALVDLTSAQAKIVQPAAPPSSASSPRTARNTIVAAVLGLTLTLALVLARDAFRMHSQ